IHSEPLSSSFPDQFGRCRSLRETSGQCPACFLDRFDHGVTEFLVLKMRAHSLDKPLPESLAEFLVNCLIADHGKLACAWRYKNQHGISFRRLVHPKPVKLLLCRNQGIAIQLPALNINADLAGSFCFGIFDRLHNPIVLEFTEKFLCSHRLPTSTPSTAPETSPTPAKATQS